MDLSTRLAVAVVATCVIGMALGFASWRRPSSRSLSRAAVGSGLVGLALSVITWAVRWWLAGHLPLFGTYESSLSLAVAVLIGAALVRPKDHAGAGIWPVACGAAAALVAHGLRFDPTAFALTISERSWVVDVHAVLAWAAFGALTANAAFALRRLVTRPSAPGKRDRLLTFSLSLGFVLHSAMMASGSFYKFLLFGRVWSFDPVETLGFAAWIAYGTLLHMYLFAGWEGRRLAGWCLAVFVLLVVSYRGIVYFPAWSTYHIFDMDLRIHLTGAETVEPGDAP
jgi:ABC-type transport system involved in cytochrome c biogenesis permease subunit